MAIRNILKRVGDKAKLLALVAGIGAVGATGCIEPEGVLIKRPADGFVDSAERKARLEAAADLNTNIDHNNEVFLGLVNDDEVAIAKRMKERGLSWRGLGDLHLHTSDDFKGLRERYQYSSYGTEIPDNFSAFFSRNNDTIYMQKWPFISMVPTFYHEFGHYKNGHNFNPTGSLVEIPAESMRVYSEIFRRSQDRATGTVLGRSVLVSNAPQDVAIDSADDISRYQIGAMVFYMEANNQDGDLDKAIDSIRRADGKKLQHIIDDGLARNAGFSAREIWFNEIGDLLNSDGFLNYLETLNLQKGANRTEAEELKDYLKIMSKDALITQKGTSLEPVEDDIKERYLMLEDFVEKGMSAQFFNPDFKNRAINDITQKYNGETIELIVRNGMDSWRDVVKVSDRVININEGYPCEHEIFECPNAVSKYRPEHLDAYFYNISARCVIGQQDEALAVADNFLAKFYPEGNYAYTDNDPVLAPRMLKVVEKAYLYSRTFAFRANMDSDSVGYDKYMCRAFGYLRILNEATCSNVSDEELRQKCYDDSGIGRSENSYQNVDLPLMESELEGKCQ